MRAAHGRWSVCADDEGDGCLGLLASISVPCVASSTMESAVMRRVGGMVMSRPSSVVNWLERESLPETKGAL